VQAAFKWINGPLRDMGRYFNQMRPHPMPATVAYIEAAIKKMRVVAELEAGPSKKGRRPHHGDPGSTILWRGLRNVTIAQENLARGGTELAPMSTTTDAKVAAAYSLHENGSILIRLKVNNFMQMGASLKWVSAFPSEAEVLFPPLT